MSDKPFDSCKKTLDDGKHGELRNPLPRSIVDELAGMVHPRDGHPKLFAMIEAYLDESGIHDGAPMCVIAGYFGEQSEWRRFESAWRGLLHQELVDMADFHALDLFKKKGRFYRWGNAIHQDFVAKVLDTILRFEVHPISSGIVNEDFYHFSLEERQYMTGATIFRNGRLDGGCPSKPYFVPFQGCVRKIAEYAPKNGRAHFAFGLDRSFYKYANDLFLDMKLKAPASWREKLGHTVLPLAAQTPGLQAADVFTYLTYVHMKTHRRPDGWVDEPGPELRFLLQRAKSRDDFTCFSKPDLQVMLGETKALLDAAGVPSPINKESESVKA